MWRGGRRATRRQHSEANASSAGKASSFLRAEQIVRKDSPPHSSQSNGLIERENRTIQEKAMCMLYSYELPQVLWAEAMNTAVYLLNRLTFCRHKGKTPFELWTGQHPDVSHLRVFGCDAYAMDPQRKKMDKKTVKGIHVGYSPSADVFRVYIPEKRNVWITRDVSFDEDSYAGRKRVFDDFIPRQQKEKAAPIPKMVQQERKDTSSCESSSDSETERESDHNDGAGPESVDDDGDDSAGRRFVTPPVTPVRRGPGRPAGSKNSVKPPPAPHKMTLRSTTHAMLAYGSSCDGDPVTVKEALEDEDSAGWIKAMEEEMSALAINKTWILTLMPAEKKAIRCRWIFKRKKVPDGTVSRLKARLEKGFCQQKGIDYDETYAPVVRHESIRVKNKHVPAGRVLVNGTRGSTRSCSSMVLRDQRPTTACTSAGMRANEFCCRFTSTTDFYAVQKRRPWI